MFRSSLRAAAAALLTLLATLGPARAQSQTDLVDPTAWQLRNLNSLSSIDQVIQSGYRMVDVEVEETVFGLRYGGSFVRNAGAYAKSWWWYYGQTEAQVTSRLSQHNARLIDVEPYDTVSGVRYAICLIPNTGQDFASSHGWQTGMSFSQVTAWLNSNPGRRILDVQPYVTGGSQRYAFSWVSNSGNTASTYWIYLNTTASTIESLLQTNNARLIDLEPHDDTGRMSAIMVPNDGKQWLWYVGIPDTAELERLAEQHASRIIDFERYTDSTGSVRYAAVMRRNSTDVNVDTTYAMRQFLPASADSGFLVRAIGASGGSVASVFASRPFEPASLMKTVHHFVACDRIALGIDSFNSLIIENQGLIGSCPTGTSPIGRSLRNVLRDMMESSSNTATEAVRARYGSAFIENRAAAFGATGVELNHTLGCLCGNPRNQIRLDDLADLHDAVADGALGGIRDDFYDLMTNGSNFGMGSFSTTDVLNDELAASNLTAEEESAFRDGLRFAFKGGGYTCASFLAREDHRSRAGYLRIPFRSGCGTDFREYFIGAWVNDATSDSTSNNATGAGLASLFRERVRAAIASWEMASCTPFASYCTAAANSTGIPGVTAPNGSPFLVTNSIAIEGRDLPANQFGLLLYSTTTGFTPGVGGGSGNLCVGSPLVRFNGSIQSSGASGTTSHPVDLTALPSPTGARTVEPGETLYFQWWFRDFNGNGQATSNLTRGLRATFI